MGSPGKTSTRKHSLLGTSEGRLWESLSLPSRGQRAAAALARREPDGMTSSAAPAWNAAGEGAGCPVPIVRLPHPPASRSRAGVAERPWGPFPSVARAEMPQTALGSPSPRVPVYTALCFGFGALTSRNVSKPPEKSEHPGLLPLGPTRPRQCAMLIRYYGPEKSAGWWVTGSGTYPASDSTKPQSPSY